MTPGSGRSLTQPVLRLHASHVYANARLLAEVIALIPAALRSEGLLALLPAPLRASIPEPPVWRAGAQSAAIIARLLWRDRDWAPWRRAGAFDAASARVRAWFAESASAGRGEEPHAILAAIERARDELGGYLAVVSWGMVFAYVAFHLTSELARRWAPGLDAERAALTVGLPGTASLDAHRELVGLGRRLRADPSLAAAACAESFGMVRERLSQDRTGVGEEFRRFIAAPRPSPDRPRPPPPDALRGPRDRPANRLARRRRDDRLRWRARTARARRPPRSRTPSARGAAGTFRRPVFRASLAAAQRYYVVRENMRYHADYFLARLRTLAIDLGAHLAARGIVAQPIDVCFLRLDEIATALDEGESCAAVVAERRAAFALDAADPPPETLDGAGEDAAPASAFPVELRGEIGAPGRCTARARIVHGVDDFAAVERGDVVVARYTDPGWTPILELAAGLVLESGGQLSHGAIVARELGIPALVNVAGATRAITSGDTVELDATTGAVRVVARARR